MESRADDRVAGAAPLRVLIVDDSALVAAVIAEALHDAGMQTRVALTGAAAIVAKAEFHPDVALIDLGLPDINGLHLVARFGREADCGVIVVTADAAAASLVAGLNSGADDYVIKPAALPELTARIRAVHRRLTRAEPEPEVPGPALTVDPARGLLIGPGDACIALTGEEAAVLNALLDTAGDSVSREALSQMALKRRLRADDHRIDQVVLALQGKIASLGGSDRAILSAGRHGYIISEPGRLRLLPEREEGKEGQGSALDPPGGGGPLDPIP